MTEVMKTAGGTEDDRACQSGMGVVVGVHCTGNNQKLKKAPYMKRQLQRGLEKYPIAV